MNSKRLIVFGGLLLSGFALIIYLYQDKTQPPLKSTLAPVYELAGKSTSAVNRALTRVIPIDELDEKEYGEAIAVGYEARANKTDPDFLYLNNLLHGLKPLMSKPFNYRVYTLNAGYANAFAMPGGVIVVTKGLLNQMRSEAEVVAVLSHEIGHIERGHCFRTVKFELLARKLNAPTLGALADFATNLLFRHSYSKTEEHEADEYAWETLQKTEYEPRGVGLAFKHLGAGTNTASQNQHADIFRDYFMTHPPLPLRVDNYLNRAEAWWRRNRGEKRYLGKRNLTRRQTLQQMQVAQEWVTK